MSFVPATERRTLPGREYDLRDKYDALGQEATKLLLKDNQHSRKAGAYLHAESTANAMRQLKSCPLSEDLAIAR